MPCAPLIDLAVIAENYGQLTGVLARFTTVVVFNRAAAG
jgi:hypothetical protein